MRNAGLTITLLAAGSYVLTIAGRDEDDATSLPRCRRHQWPVSMGKYGNHLPRVERKKGLHPKLRRWYPGHHTLLQ